MSSVENSMEHKTTRPSRFKNPLHLVLPNTASTVRRRGPNQSSSFSSSTSNHGRYPHSALVRSTLHRGEGMRVSMFKKAGINKLNKTSVFSNKSSSRRWSSRRQPQRLNRKPIVLKITDKKDVNSHFLRPGYVKKRAKSKALYRLNKYVGDTSAALSKSDRMISLIEPKKTPNTLNTPKSKPGSLRAFEDTFKARSSRFLTDSIIKSIESDSKRSKMNSLVKRPEKTVSKTIEVFEDPRSRLKLHELKALELEETLCSVIPENKIVKLITNVDHEIELYTQMRKEESKRKKMRMLRSRRNRNGKKNSKSTKKGENPDDLLDHFFIDVIDFKQDIPRPITFTRHLRNIIKVDSSGKCFPAHLCLDKPNLEFDFYSTFDGRTPTEEDYDHFSFGNFVHIEPKPEYYKMKGRIETLLILMIARRAVTVMLSISFTSNNMSLATQRRKFKIFSKEHEKMVDSILYRAWKERDDQLKRRGENPKKNEFSRPQSPRKSKKDRKGSIKKPPISRQISPRAPNQNNANHNSSRAKKSSPRTERRHSMQPGFLTSITQTEESPRTRNKRINSLKPGQATKEIENMNKSRRARSRGYKQSNNMFFKIRNIPKNSKLSFIKKNVKRAKTASPQNRMKTIYKNSRRVSFRVAEAQKKKIMIEEQSKCYMYLKTQIHDIKKINRLVRQHKKLEADLNKACQWIWIIVIKLYLALEEARERVFKVRLQKFKALLIFNKFSRMQKTLSQVVKEKQYKGKWYDICIARDALVASVVLFKRGRVVGKAKEIVGLLLKQALRPMRVCMFCTKIYKILSHMNSKAKVHLQRKGDIMRNLVYLWENERLVLIDDLKDQLIVSNRVKSYIKNFDGKVRDNILDIIYNSQLNEFTIQKFDTLKKVKNKIKEYHFDPDELSELVTKRKSYNDFSKALNYMEKGGLILEQLGATNSIQEMGMRLAEIRKQNNAKISRNSSINVTGGSETDSTNQRSSLFKSLRPANTESTDSFSSVLKSSKLKRKTSRKKKVAKKSRFAGKSKKKKSAPRRIKKQMTTPAPVKKNNPSADLSPKQPANSSPLQPIKKSRLLRFNSFQPIDLSTSEIMVDKPSASPKSNFVSEKKIPVKRTNTVRLTQKLTLSKIEEIESRNESEDTISPIKLNSTSLERVTSTKKISPASKNNRSLKTEKTSPMTKKSNRMFAKNLRIKSNKRGRPARSNFSLSPTRKLTDPLASPVRKKKIRGGSKGCPRERTQPRRRATQTSMMPETRLPLDQIREEDSLTLSMEEQAPQKTLTNSVMSRKSQRNSYRGSRLESSTSNIRKLYAPKYSKLRQKKLTKREQLLLRRSIFRLGNLNTLSTKYKKMAFNNPAPHQVKGVESIKKTFNILFMSKKLFKIEIDSLKLKTFILGYALWKEDIENQFVQQSYLSHKKWRSGYKRRKAVEGGSGLLE